MEPCEGEPWPLGRAGHAACCLGDHNHLLVTGGISGDGVTMVDIWLFNLTLRKWTEVRFVQTPTHITTYNEGTKVQNAQRVT